MKHLIGTRNNDSFEMVFEVEGKDLEKWLELGFFDMTHIPEAHDYLNACKVTVERTIGIVRRPPHACDE